MPGSLTASNNFLEVADNFLDFEGAIRLARWHADVRFSRTCWDYRVLLHGFRIKSLMRLGKSHRPLARIIYQSIKGHLGKKAEVELTEVVGSLRVQ